jgi:O-antigen ligase
VLEAAVALVLLALVRGERRRGRLLLAVVGCLLALSVAGAGSGDRYAAEISTRFHEITPQLDSYRTQEYHAVWREIRRDVVFGSGFGTEYTGDWTIYRSWSHNAYEWLWWRLGLVGLACFLGLLGGAVAAGVGGARRLEGDEKGLAIGLTAAVVFTALAANLHENFENFQTNALVAVLLAQLIVLGSRARGGGEAR